MKLWSKEALVLGGIYGVLDTPFSLLGLEMLSNAVFLLFVAGVFLLCFNKTPKLLTGIISKYPRTSYYLAAVGWIPYAVAVIFLALVGYRYFYEVSDDVITKFAIYLPYGILFFVFISLLATCIKMRKNKK